MLINRQYIWIFALSLNFINKKKEHKYELSWFHIQDQQNLPIIFSISIGDRFVLCLVLQAISYFLSFHSVSIGCCFVIVCDSFLLMATTLTCHLNVIKVNAQKCIHMPSERMTNRKRGRAERKYPADGIFVWTKSNKAADNRNNDEQKNPIEFSASRSLIQFPCTYVQSTYTHSQNLLNSTYQMQSTFCSAYPKNWMDYFFFSSHFHTGPGNR